MNKMPLNAKKILNEIISNKKKGILEIRPRDINQNERFMNDKSWKIGIDWLMKFKIIEKRVVKKNEVYYSLNHRYLWQALKIGRQNSDISELQSFPFKDVINLTSTTGKTTIYGLPEEVFYKSNFESKIFDYSQKETLDFVRGIKTINILGKSFGTPLKVKINLDKQISEEEIVNRQVEYYLDLLKQGAKPENLFKTIITTHRNSKIGFNKLGENISNHLIELKRKHRRKKIIELYGEKLKGIKNTRLKSNLVRLKKGFIGILAHTDYDKNFLKRTIFEFYGTGVGGYSSNENPKMFWSFHKFIKSLDFEEKKILFNFLGDIFKENKELYPTNVAFICRGHSVDIFPEGVPLS